MDWTLLNFFQKFCVALAVAAGLGGLAAGIYAIHVAWTMADAAADAFTTLSAHIRKRDAEIMEVINGAQNESQ